MDPNLNDDGGNRNHREEDDQGPPAPQNAGAGKKTAEIESKNNFVVRVAYTDTKDGARTQEQVDVCAICRHKDLQDINAFIEMLSLNTSGKNPNAVWSASGGNNPYSNVRSHY